MTNPKIRFKADNGKDFPDWKEKAIGDGLVELTEYALKSSGYPLMTSSRKGLFIQEEYFNNAQKSEDDTKFSLVKRGNITYRHMSDDNIFHFNKNDICDCGLVSKEYPVFETKPEIINDIFLLEHLNSSPNFLSFCAGQKKGGTRTRLYFKVLKTYKMFMPIATEQKKIAEFLSNVDDVIAASEQEVEKYKELKKGYLQKMFPKDDAKVPEIRFPGFTGDWEQRKLEDIGVAFSTGNLGYADLVENGKYKCVLYGELYTKYNERIFNVSSTTNVEATKTELNDILFPTSTTVDSISLIAPSCVNQEDIRVGGDMFGIRPYEDIDGSFISYCINNFIPVKYSLAKKAQGLTIVHLHYNAIKDEQIMIPSLTEQRQISDFFIRLDNLITLAQREVDKWKELKKGLLQQMFV